MSKKSHFAFFSHSANGHQLRIAHRGKPERLLFISHCSKAGNSFITQLQKMRTKVLAYRQAAMDLFKYNAHYYFQKVT